MLRNFAQIVASFLVLVLFLYYYHRKRCCKDHPLVTEWPILGMLPPFLGDLCHFQDLLTQALQTQGGTANFHGPWFTEINSVMTCDPMNAHHIMSKNFGNHVKGPKYRRIFRAFGEGVLVADLDSWKYRRTILHSLFATKSFDKFREKIIREKVESCLIPLLDHVVRQGLDVDLQDVFNRFSFDTISSVLLGRDPKCLAVDFPEIAWERALNESEEFSLYRHVVPRSVWKLRRWLGIGPEKKMFKTIETFDQFLLGSIASKREEIRQRKEMKKEEDDDHDLLMALLMKEEEGKQHFDDRFLRDSAFTLYLAGRETVTLALTWFFWLVTTNPSVEAKILEEIKRGKEVKDQVYLHGALCEALRLYPPIPIVRRQAIKHDKLPSGHEVGPNTVILLSLYAMGRCAETWGKDCLEFKPERWISEKGGILHVPSYRFFSFTAGPRICLGKNLSFIQMKMVATAILRNYQVGVVKDHPVTPAVSILLKMKHGLKVRITKRE